MDVDRLAFSSRMLLGVRIESATRLAAASGKTKRKQLFHARGKTYLTYAYADADADADEGNARKPDISAVRSTSASATSAAINLADSVCDVWCG